MDGKPCKLCGAPIVGRWKSAIYCSSTCQKDAHLEQTLATYHTTRAAYQHAPRVCQWKSCGTVFTPVHGKQIYCSVTCRTRYQNYAKAVTPLRRTLKGKSS